jgi:hypothetical protein
MYRLPAFLCAGQRNSKPELAADGWRYLMQHVAEHGRRIFDSPHKLGTCSSGQPGRARRPPASPACVRCSRLMSRIGERDRSQCP